MKIVRTIDIDAPPEAVWAVLMDFSKYPEWNPFILSIEGPAEVGAKLNCVSWSKLGEGYKFEPTVEVCKRPREFLWKATSLQARGAGMCMHVSCCLAYAAFTGRHRFLLTAAPGGKTSFEHSETFTGWLIPVLACLGMFRAIAGMYDKMNEALKDRVEQHMKSRK